MTRTALVILVSLLAPLRLAAQDQAITLADAIKLAQRRSAWGAFLPSLSASSSASDFFSGGASRIDPVTGQVLSGNTTNRSLNASLRASVDLFTGFRRGAELKAARAGQTEAEAGLVDARFAQDLATTNQFFDALSAAQLVGGRQSSVRRAEEQLKVSVAKLHAGSATRSDSLRSLVTLGSAQLDLIQAQTDLATAEAGLGRLVGETGRVRALDDSSFHQLAAMPDTAALRQEAETRSPRV